MKKGILYTAIAGAVAAGAYALLSPQSPQAVSYVPADTIFFVGGNEPFPLKDNLQSVKQFMNVGQAYQGFIDQIKSDIGDAEDIPAGAEMLLTLWSDMSELMQNDALLSTYSLPDEIDSALYAIGIIPVMRMEVNDAAVFDARIESIAKKADIEFTHETMGTASVYRFLIEEKDSKGNFLNLIIATNQGSAIITFETQVDTKKTLDLALGLSLPEVSLADSGQLDKVIANNNFLPSMVGYLSTYELLNGLTSKDANNLATMLSS